MVFTSECNCCGKEFPRLTPAKIEGAIIDVCDKCSKFGSKVDVKVEVAVDKPPKPVELEQNVELVADYGKLIARIREDKGLSIYDFAQKINEKESVIKRLEFQEFQPDVELVRKIENFLDIRLREKYEDVLISQKSKKQIDLTVGDVVEVS